MSRFTRTSVTDCSILDTRLVSSGPDTVLDTDKSIIATANTFTINLPIATGSGRLLYIKSVSIGLITIDGNDSDTIDGLPDLTLLQYDCIIVMDYIANKWVIL